MDPDGFGPIVNICSVLEFDEFGLVQIDQFEVLTFKYKVSPTAFNTG